MDDIDETQVVYEYIKEYNEGVREGRRKILRAQNDPRGPGFFNGEESLMENQDLIFGMGKYKRKPMDFYPTPAEVTNALIDHLEKNNLIHKGDYIYEPACGEGDMVKVFASRGYNVRYSDIRDTEFTIDHGGGGIDFLKNDIYLSGIKWIITNPPFNVSEQFIRKCFEHDTPFALLLKSQYWHSGKRNPLFYERRPMYVCPLCWRPAFEGKGKASLMDFVWTIWDSKDSEVTKYVPLKKPV